MDIPFFEETVYSCGVLRLRFVVACHAILFIERHIPADVLDVDFDLWSYRQSMWRISQQATGGME